MHTTTRGWLRLAACAAALGLAPAAQAQERGFQLERYEPTTAGEPDLVVSHPWYRSTRLFAAGLTFDQATNPLALERDADGNPDRARAEVGTQLVGHLDLAASPFDFLTCSASLPMTLHESGTPDSRGLGPLSGTATADPRLGVMFRLGGEAERDPISAHLGADYWFPIGSEGSHAGDARFRLAPRLVLAGTSGSIEWAAQGSLLFRQAASLEGLPARAGDSADTELQLGGALGFVSPDRALRVGPELSWATQLGTQNFDATDQMGLEALVGLHYLVARTVQVSAGFGLGAFHGPGTPSSRGVIRVAYAPRLD